jgi:CDP-6-deoxy-D-xylo-4-hexulose-3-dehydrase
MNQEFKWPLNVNNFTWLDRLKIACFILNSKNRWTQGERVKKFEEQMAKYSNHSHSVFVSSGSTANTLLAMYAKENIMDKSSGKNVVVLPAVTWQTSCSPWIREGFEPRFIDVSFNDLSMDLDKLEEYLRFNANYVAVVFVTSLLGMRISYKRLKEIGIKYNVKIMIDECENTLNMKYNPDNYHGLTSTTSTYFGHQLQSIEGGFIFTNNLKEYEYFLMARNHGMTRSIEDPLRKNIYLNPAVDERFDFNILGNNFRNTDLNAYIGSLDFKRINRYHLNRKTISFAFLSCLDKVRYFNFEKNEFGPLFCLPIIINKMYFSYEEARVMIAQAKRICRTLGIETRPIVSGNMVNQTAYKYLGLSPKDFPKAEWLDKCGFYVGLHDKLEISQVTKLVIELNKV